MRIVGTGFNGNKRIYFIATIIEAYSIFFRLGGGGQKTFNLLETTFLTLSPHMDSSFKELPGVEASELGISGVLVEQTENLQGATVG